MNDPEQSWPSYEAWQGEYPNALASFDDVLSGASGRRVVVFLDYDGTLTPIVSNPDAALLSPLARETVRRLARALPTAIISGRGREKVQEFVKLKELYYAGSHGMDIAGPVADDGVDADAAGGAGGAGTRLPSVTEGQAEGDPTQAAAPVGASASLPEASAWSDRSADPLSLVGADVAPAALVTGDSPSARSAVECPVDRRAKRFGEEEQGEAGEGEQEDGSLDEANAREDGARGRARALRAAPPRAPRISFAEDRADPPSDARASASADPDSSDEPSDSSLPSLSSLLSGVSASGAPSAVFAQSLSARPAVGGSATTPFASRAPAASPAAVRCPSRSDLADLDASPSPLPLPPRPLSSIRSMPACRALPLSTSRSLPGDAATRDRGGSASDDATAAVDANVCGATDPGAARAAASAPVTLCPSNDASDGSSPDPLPSPPIATRASLQSLASLPALPPLSGPPLPGLGGGASSAGRRALRRSGASQPSLSAFQPAARFASLMDRLFAELTAAVRTVPGAAVEHNKFCLSVHFRNCPPDRVDDVRALVARAVAGEPELRVTRGRKVLELRPKIDWDKGRAVVHVLKALGLARHQGGAEGGASRGDGKREAEPSRGDGKREAEPSRSVGGREALGAAPLPNGRDEGLERGRNESGAEAAAGGGRSSSAALPLPNGSSGCRAPGANAVAAAGLRALATPASTATAAPAFTTVSTVAPPPPVSLASPASPPSSASGPPPRVALSSPDPDEWDAYAIYIGDDRTDEDAFRALKRLNAGVGIKVSSLPRPSEALWSLRDPDDVIAFLARLEVWARGKHNLWRNEDVVCEGWTYRA